MEKELGTKMLEGASAGANVLGAYTRGKAARGQAFYNAAMADIEAADVRNVGNSAAARAEGKTDGKVGSVKAKVAGRGFNAHAGTANTVADATDFVGRLDALMIRENTRRAVIGKRTEADGHRLRADSISPGTEAAGTLIGESGLLARRWSQQEREGS